MKKNDYTNYLKNEKEKLKGTINELVLIVEDGLGNRVIYNELKNNRIKLNDINNRINRYKFNNDNNITS